MVPFVQHNEDLISQTRINKEFKEIAFHGVIKNQNISRILELNRESAIKISFLKNDLKFVKVTRVELLKWLENFQESLVSFITINIEITVNTSANQRITLKSLRKLWCYDEILPAINAPNLQDVRIFSKDQLTAKALTNINEFLTRHRSIKKFSYRIFCGDDDNVQHVAFNLNHFQLTDLELAEFRYSPEAVIDILKSQKNLRKLHLEDGSITGDDFKWTKKFEPIFEEILSMNYLNKLVIETPTIKFLNKLRNIKSLKRLYINAITADVLEEFLNLEHPRITKLGIESIEGSESKKVPLKTEQVWKIGSNFPNLECLKFDIAPIIVVDAMIKHMGKLRSVKIYHSMDTVKKFKTNLSEDFSMSESRLDKMIFEQEDFKLRILPIVKASRELRYLKIYWRSKNTPIMSMIFDILEYCPKMHEILFKYNEVYSKEDAIPFKSHFQFAYNSREYQMILCRKNGKIKCVKL